MIDYTEIDERIRIRNPLDLLKCDRVIYVNKFNEQSVKQFKDEFMDAHETGQEIIPIVIDSFGGAVYSALAMSDFINSTDKIVATIAMGKAMSAGAILLTCGHEGYRFASPTSTIMIHDVSMGTHGKMEEIKADAKEGERLNKLIFDIMEKNCGLEKGTLLDQLRKKHNSTDWFLTPQQAKKLNIINHIKIPKLITKVEVTTELI
jgi:ATP-dependent Clp protease protease subunit